MKVILIPIILYTHNYAIDFEQILILITTFQHPYYKIGNTVPQGYCILYLSTDFQLLNTNLKINFKFDY